MSATPLVTVVIPTYNQAHFLREALQSLQSQTFTNWEAIIVNNYSDDDTITVVESFADRRIRLENFRNQGIIAASRNRGIEFASGQYLAFLDSDDTWYPGKLARCVDILSEDVDLVSHGLRWIGDREKVVFCGPERRASFDALLDKGNCITPSATVVRRDLVRTVGGFSENPAIVTSEDYHLWIKLAKVGTRMRFIKETLGEYRIHSGSQSSSVLRHLNSVLCVIAEFLPVTPSDSFTTRMRLRRRLGLAHYSAGRSMQTNGQFIMSLPLFVRSLAYWPFYPKIYASMALSIIGYWPYSRRRHHAKIG